MSRGSSRRISRGISRRVRGWLLVALVVLVVAAAALLVPYLVYRVLLNAAHYDA